MGNSPDSRNGGSIDATGIAKAFRNTLIRQRKLSVCFWPKADTRGGKLNPVCGGKCPHAAYRRQRTMSSGRALYGRLVE